jgi:hypothetical protein
MQFALQAAQPSRKQPTVDGNYDAALGFKPFHEHKERHLITGFMDLGVPSVVANLLPNSELVAYDWAFPLLKAT